MTEDKLKEIVRSYIINSVECGAGGSLHEADEFDQLSQREMYTTVERAYALFDSAIITVGWDNDSK